MSLILKATCARKLRLMHEKKKKDKLVVGYLQASSANIYALHSSQFVP
jgi:hypothetical protein